MSLLTSWGYTLTEVSSLTDIMTDEEFNSMLKLSLNQAQKNKGYDLDEAFDILEKNA